MICWKRFIIGFLFVVLVVNVWTANYTVYHEYKDSEHIKMVSSTSYYRDDIFIGHTFGEPDKLIIKSNMLYMNPEIMYTENLIFMDYKEHDNYALMEFWDNTEYLIESERYILCIDTRLFDIKKDVTHQFK